jgi:hypothetical protein
MLLALPCMRLIGGVPSKLRRLLGPRFGVGTVFLLIACSAGSPDGDGTGDGDGDGDGTGSTGSGTGGSGNGDGDGDGDIDPGQAGGSGGSDGKICQSFEVTSEPKPPVILILLDQSGSMKDPVEETTRWAAATSSLFEATAALEVDAQFGLIGFPRHVVLDDTDDAQTCSADLYVNPALSSAAAIEGAIKIETPTKGHTPVRAALTLARTELNQPVYQGENRYVILVTDGLPNCAPGATERWHIDYTVPDLVAQLAADGIRTFVVGYDIAALAGQWSPPNDTYYAHELADAMAQAGGTEMHRPVSSGEEFINVLTDITQSVAPCAFELAAAPQGGPEYVRVTVDDIDYPFDDPSGWYLEWETTVSFPEDGAVCALLRDRTPHNIKIQVECEVVVVPVR